MREKVVGKEGSMTERMGEVKRERSECMKSKKCINHAPVGIPGWLSEVMLLPPKVLVLILKLKV